MATAIIEKSGTHTRSVKYSLQHTWVIDNFSNLYVPNAETTDPEYRKIFSKSFNCSQEKRIRFQMYLYPKGNTEENKDYIALFLDLSIKEPVKVPIHFKFSILNDRNQKKYSLKSHLVFTKSTARGWHKFVERSVLLDKTNGYLANDQLTLLCEIEMYSEPIAKLAGDTCLEDLTSLTIAKNSEMYGNLLESGDHSDVVLVVDGERLKAHKAILSTHSPVFKAMFEANMKEKAEGRVVIEDLSIDVAKKLLKFIYTGKAESLDTLAEELLSAAEKYGLDLLKQICGQFMIGQVTTENAARYLVLADRHSILELKSTCFEYIRNHSIDVMLTQDWSLVDQQVVEELRQLTLKEKKTTKKPDSAK